MGCQRVPPIHPHNLILIIFYMDTAKCGYHDNVYSSWPLCNRKIGKGTDQVRKATREIIERRIMRRHYRKVTTLLKKL